jgi:cation:H+ antiporter
MLLSVIAVMAGFIILVWGADRTVTGAAAIARNLGVSPLIIGLTIIGFGTSAPEMLVSAVAAWQGNAGLAVGNAIGSNITNIALVLGATAIIYPLDVHSDVLRREFPILFATMALALVLMLDSHLDRLDGTILLLGMAAMMFWLVHIGLRSRQENTDPLGEEFADEIPQHMPRKQATVWVVLGIAALLISSRMLVWGAVDIATRLGVSDLVIGLTIVALGTSLPELAAALMGAIRKEHDIAIGNIIGSNMFNLLAVLGIAAVIGPSPFGAEVLQRDIPLMIALTVALFLMAMGFRGTGRINRIEGVLLTGVYCGYQAYLYTSALGNL